MGAPQISFDDFKNNLAVASDDYGPPAKGPESVDLSAGSLPPYQRPKLLGQRERDQAAADSVASTENAAADNIAANITTPAQLQQAPPIQQQPAQTGLQPAQQTITRTVLDPGLMAKQGELVKNEKSAITSRVNADIAQNDLVAAEMKNRASFLQQDAEEKERNDAKRQQIAQQKLDDVTTAVQNFNANSKINPKRYEENMGVGGRILATIGQAFGAFGAAITHSPNYAQQMIERAIDADIKAQEHDVATLGQKVNFAQNQYAEFRNQGLDADAARTATRMLKLQQSGAKIDQLMAGTKDAQLLAQAQQVKAGIDDAALKTAMEYGKSQISTVKAAPTAPSMANQLEQRKLEVEVPQKDPKTGKELPSKTFLAKSPQDAEKIRSAFVVAWAIKSNLSRMKKLVETTSQSISPTAKIEVEKLNDQLATQFGVLNGLGALSDKDYKIASQLGDPTSFWQRDSTTLKLIDQYEGNINTMVEGELRGRGLIK